MSRPVLLALAITLLTHLDVRGQRDTSLVDTTRMSSSSARLSLDVRGLYDSNALRNDLLTDLWRGGTLTDEVRQSTQADLKGWNRAGYEAEVRLSYTWGRGLFGNAAWRPMISMAHHDVLGLRFTDDVYNLTFFGNAAYEGKTAVLAPTALEQQRYQTFGFGVRAVHRENFVRLDVVNGQYLNALDLDQADLYTAEDGRYLEADLDGSWHTSDTIAQSLGSNNGTGVSLSGGAEFHFASVRMRVRVEDLGFIAWDDASLRLDKNEVVRYDGLYVDDLIDLDGSLLGEAQVRDSLGLSAEAGGYLRALPTRFRIAFSRSRRHSRFRTAPRPEEFTIEQFAVPGYIPHLTYTHSVLLSRRLLGYGSLSYGGFGGLRVGTGLWGEFYWGLVKLDIPNLVGLVSLSAKGRALSFGVAFNL